MNLPSLNSTNQCRHKALSADYYVYEPGRNSIANTAVTLPNRFLSAQILALACLTSFLLTGTAGAAIIARFDAGPTTATAVQSTFTAIGHANGTNLNGPETATDGSITLRLTAGTTLALATTKDGSGDFNSTGAIFSRDRAVPGADNGSFTYSDVYRDFLTANFMGIQLSGLTANSQYAITFYAYDNSGGRTQTFTDITPSGTGNSGTVTYTAASSFTSSTSNNVFSTTINATSDASGRLFFSESGLGNTNVAVFNGLVVDAIPEPSSALLGALGVLLLMRRRR